MAQDNQRLINVIRQAVHQETEQGAKMKLTPGKIHAVSGYMVSAYVRDDDLIEDINIPAGMHVQAGDYVSVGELETTAWIDRLIPTSAYAKTEVDWNDGKVYAGTGAAVPAHVLSIDPNAMWPSGTFDLGAPTAPFAEVRATTVDGGNGNLFLSAPSGSQVYIGTQNSTSYVRLGHATNGATNVLPGSAGDVNLGNSDWKFNSMLAEYHYAEGESLEGYLILRRDNGGAAATTWTTQGIVAGQAWDGNSWHTMSQIRFLTEDTVTDGAVDGRIAFWTASNDGVLTQRVFLNSEGHWYPNTDEAYRIGYQNGGSFSNIVGKFILPANTGTPATGASIGNSGSVWPDIWVNNVQTTGVISLWPSSTKKINVSSTDMSPETDGDVDLGTTTKEWGTVYAKTVVTSKPTVQTYTSTGANTWNKPANLSYISVEVVGAGGGGGGADNTTTTEGASGGGGGGGGYALQYFDASELPSSCTATVGAGGSAGSGAGSDGGSGGTSSFAGTGITTVQATGGGGGSGDLGGTGRAINNGGSVGVGSGGAVNINGEPGWHGDRVSLSGVAAATGLASGKGGDSPRGFGYGGRWDNGGASYGGSGYGHGGTGAYNHNSGAASAGAAGGDGIIIVTEFYA